jgi:hypothetical protein
MFAKDFKCAYDATHVEEVDHQYVVTGCNETETYICWPHPVKVEECKRADAVEDDSPPPKETWDPVTPPGRLTQQSDVVLRNNGGHTVVILELTLDENTLLRASASSTADSDPVELTLVRRERDESADGCAMDLLVQGELAQRPVAAASRKEDVVSQRAQLTHKSFGEFAHAEQLAVRVCKRLWKFAPPQIVKLREFDARLRQESQR